MNTQAPSIQFQGDICFVEVEAIPADAKPMKAEGGVFILAHSETGHHHTVDAMGCVAFDAKDPNVCFLQLETTHEVVHHRPWDTHASIFLDAGKTYMGVRQVERSPEGWVRVAD